MSDFYQDFSSKKKKRTQEIAHDAFGYGNPSETEAQPIKDGYIPVQIPGGIEKSIDVVNQNGQPVFIAYDKDDEPHAFRDEQKAKDFMIETFASEAELNRYRGQQNRDEFMAERQQRGIGGFDAEDPSGDEQEQGDHFLNTSEEWAEGGSKEKTPGERMYGDQSETVYGMKRSEYEALSFPEMQAVRERWKKRQGGQGSQSLLD